MKKLLITLMVLFSVFVSRAYSADIHRMKIMDESDNLISSTNPFSIEVFGTDYVSGKSGVDGSTESLITMSYDHHEIHDGYHYYVQDVQDLAINNVFDVQFTTPASSTHSHFVFEINPEAETDWYIYEGVVINTAGTAITPRNNNRNSANTSINTIAGISNTSVALANADTAVASATLINYGKVGAGRTGGVVERDREIILKANTKYCFRAIATVAGYIDFLMEWYEHASKN